MANATDIVGYTYNADVYCPDCIVGRVRGFAVGIAGLGESVEAWLDAMAAGTGINRDDESSFDSGDFPKVVFRSMLSAYDSQHDHDFASDDRCGLCGEVLGE